jgi:hypothetical protein
MLDAEGNNARRAIPPHNTKFNRTISEIECASARSQHGYAVKGVDHNGSDHGGCETLKRRKDETNTRLASIIKVQFLSTSEWFKVAQARQCVLEVMSVGSAIVTRHADAQTWAPIIANRGALTRYRVRRHASPCLEDVRTGLTRLGECT